MNYDIRGYHDSNPKKFSYFQEAPPKVKERINENMKIEKRITP